MHHKSHPLTHVEHFQQGIQIPPMFNKGVRSGTTVGQLRRITHADEVRGDYPTQRFGRGHNVAPEVRGGRVAVQKDNWITASRLYIGHLQSQNLLMFFLIRKCCAHQNFHSLFFRCTNAVPSKKAHPCTKTLSSRHTLGRSNMALLQHNNNHSFQTGRIPVSNPCASSSANC